MELSSEGFLWGHCVLVLGNNSHSHVRTLPFTDEPFTDEPFVRGEERSP